MRSKIFWNLLGIFGVASMLISCAPHPAPIGSPHQNSPSSMELTSSAFKSDQSLPTRFTCDADGISPPLEIGNPPSGVKSFALLMDDPDAPSGSFLHWIMWDIPGEAHVIAEGSAPSGAVEGPNGTGEKGYFGPCPPSGTHHYRFHLFALDTMLGLSASTERPEVEAAMQGHILADTVLAAIYTRSK